MKLKDGVGTTVLENHYTFDLIGNILSMENVAGVIPGSYLGGPSLQSYGYDQFNRLATATGSWTGSSNAPAGSNQSAEYSLSMDYGPMHRILSKTQNHELDGNVQEANSYANQYEYQVSGKPNAVSRISRVVGGQTQEELFDYDANGNAMSHTFGGGAVGEDRMMLWDETNMMKAIRMGELSFYHNIYDGTGTRVMKGIGDIDVMTVGGQQQLSATTGNYTVYVSPYVTINAHGMLSKHYYAGDDKLATRLAGEAADFDSGTPLSGQNTGSLTARQEDDLQHVYDEFGLGTVDIENLPPAMDDCESQGDCAQVLYYYHKDHIGSSSMVTDGTGAVYQYLMYLPFGESMAEQKLGGYSSRYRFTGKELDPLSGLYDFGARYYDPRLSVWFGVDPLAHETPNWTPYNYTLNNPIRYIDPDGRSATDPPCGRVMGIFFHGGPTGGGKTTTPAKAGVTGDFYNSTKAYASGAGRDFVGTVIAPGVTSASGVETAMNFINENLQDGDQLVIYGYSYGVDVAVDFATQLKELGVDVSLLITVDGSDGPLQNSTVNTTIPDNVGTNLNVYQTNDSGTSSLSRSTGATPSNSSSGSSSSDSGTSNFPGSNGGPNRAADPGKTKVINRNATAPGTTHGNIQSKEKSTINNTLRENIQGGG